MRIALGDYVVRRDAPSYLWEVICVVVTQREVLRTGGANVPVLQDRIRVAAFCDLQTGQPVDRVLQEGWSNEFEHPNPLLLIALIARHAEIQGG